jgi:hypothetical protein
LKPFLVEYMPELTAHDVQFSLCEFDRVERVREGGHARRKYHPPKPKQRGFFGPHALTLTPTKIKEVV